MSCPFLKRCTRTVDFEHYRFYCKSFYYTSCSSFAEMAKEKRKPGEWEELLGEAEKE
jgi:hypothetical protein